jgi:gliding motility-associated-like protein
MKKTREGSRMRAKNALFGALLLLARVSSLAAFELPKEAVYPRIFTPNGDGINDVVYFDVVTLSQDSLEGRVYDSEGVAVADLQKAPLIAPLQPDALMWDGKDRNGNTASAGIYIYEVKSSEKTVTGTVIVAK